MNTARRDFLRTGALVAAAVATDAFDAFRERSRAGAGETRGAGYGPLRPTRDEATGLELIRLPEGFRYTTFGWTGDPLSDGKPTPDSHDGMAALAQTGDRITLIRNHEISDPEPSIAGSSGTYDPQAGGGCVRLVFDAAAGKLVLSEVAIGGTQKNCAGGPTPWGSWLTCEEAVDSAHGESKGKKLPFEKDHGFIFEVPLAGNAPATPLREMGRFVHEAIAIDPETNIVYETEDQESAGFYRFLPKVPGKLAEGGKLQALRVVGHDDVRANVPADTLLPTEWVDIADPLKFEKQPGTEFGGCLAQGKALGATTFARLEGCWFGGGKVYFVSTSGGQAKLGQIWEYDPRAEQLRLVFESPDSAILDYPDNITVSPRGGLVLCEDGDRRAERLCGLTVAGQLFPLAENNMVLAGEKNGLHGDFRKQEWCGATFSPDGKWLFANIQTPGLTLAITGPWEVGAL